MFDELLDRGLTPTQVRNLVARLSVAPWIWPVNDGTPEWLRAMELRPQGPPSLHPGEVLLLACNPVERSGGLYRLTLRGEAAEADVVSVPMGMTARRTWDTALVGLNRSLPFLWRSFETLRDCPQAAVYLASSVLTGKGESLRSDSQGLTNRSVDGPSFGLSLALAAGSILWGVPLPCDLAATGQVESTGKVTAVDGIDLKIHVLASRAPSVSRILVPKDNLEEARIASDGTRLTVVGIGNIAEALDLAFDLSGSPNRLLGTELRGEEQAEFTDRLFDLALAGRQAAVFWPPIQMAAELALEQWSPQGMDVREKLEFARHVAARHEGKNLFPAWKANLDWLDSLPRTVRKELLAHEVQQSADMGDPQPESVLKPAHAQVEPEPKNRDPEDLKLLGALARLEAVCGNPAEALRLASEATSGWLSIRRAAESTYSLSTWFRMAAVLKDPTALRDAEACLAQIERRAGLDPISRLYVALPRWQAHAACRSMNEEAELRLGRLALGRDEQDVPCPMMPDHVRWSAARWHIRFFPSAPLSAVLRGELAERASGNKAGASVAHRFQLLVGLDDALARNDDAAAAKVIRSLEDDNGSGLVPLLCAAHRHGVGGPRFVSDNFPY